MPDVLAKCTCFFSTVSTVNPLGIRLILFMCLNEATHCKQTHQQITTVDQSINQILFVEPIVHK